MAHTLRVAFTGASGTGKSTLATWVAQEYGLPYCPVGSRSVAEEMGLASPYDAEKVGRREELQRRIFEAKLKWETEIDARGVGFVTDRAYYDNLAYSMLHCHADVDEALLKRIINAQKIYTNVFFLSVQDFQDTGGDPARVDGRAYHSLFEAALRGLYEMDKDTHGDRCKHLLTGDLGIRKAIVRMVLGPP